MVRDHGCIEILVNAVGGSMVIANLQATIEQLAFSDRQKLIPFDLDRTFDQSELLLGPVGGVVAG